MAGGKWGKGRGRGGSRDMSVRGFIAVLLVGINVIAGERLHGIVKIVKTDKIVKI